MVTFFKSIFIYKFNNILILIMIILIKFLFFYNHNIKMDTICVKVHMFPLIFVKEITNSNRNIKLDCWAFTRCLAVIRL